MSALWYIDDGKLTHEYLPTPSEYKMSSPFPYFWWYVTDRAYGANNLEHIGLASPIYRGAFCNCTSLESISVPKSCLSIGDYSFRKCVFRTVRISENCTYNAETSFPDACAIYYYEEGNEEEEETEGGEGE